MDYDGFLTIFANILVENCYLHIKHRYTLRNLLELTQFSVDDRAVSDENYICGHVASFLATFLLLGADQQYKEKILDILLTR